MKSKVWKRLLLSTVLIAIAYFVLFLIIHFCNTVPLLEKAFTGFIETTDLSALPLLIITRTAFYVLIPLFISFIVTLSIEKNIKKYFRVTIETFALLYSILGLVKIAYFFSGIDKITGILILNGLDIAIMLISWALNVFCYKNPYFLYIDSKKEQKELIESKKELSQKENDMDYFDQNYNVTFFKMQRFTGSQFEIVDALGNKQKSYVVDDGVVKCRFCGRTTPEVSFRKKAHAFPESLGNKLFINKNNECDNCNGIDFNAYENDLNCFLLDQLALNGLKGKNGTRKYKSNDKKTTIEVIDGVINIKDVKGSGNVVCDKNKKTLSIKFDIKEYSLINIYKLLVKMALSILPLEKFKQYSIISDHLRDKTLFGFEHFIFSQFSGFNFSDMTVKCYEKKVADSSLPTYYFFFFNNNFSFQIPLYSNLDMMANRNKRFTIDVKYIPTPFDNNPNGGRNNYVIQISALNDIVPKHCKTIEISYESIIKENDDNSSFSIS